MRKAKRNLPACRRKPPWRPDSRRCIKMVAKTKPKRKVRPAQKQRRQPGIEAKMKPRPQAVKPEYRPAGKLEGQVALITGGDSGIGRAVAIVFAREGADVAVVYLNEHRDARETAR